MILKNKMEVICWENNVIPVIIICHSSISRQYVYSHWHKELEISWVFEGEVEFYNGGKRRLIKNRGINIANSEEVHFAIPQKGTPDSEEIVGITIQLNDSFLKGLIQDMEGLYFEISSDSAEDELIEKMERIYELYRQGDRLEIKLSQEECNEDHPFGYWCRPVKRAFRWYIPGIAPGSGPLGH